MLVFEERGKPEHPEKKPLGAQERTNNKLNPHVALTPGFEPEPHWWEATALTTAPSLAPFGVAYHYHFPNSMVTPLSLLPMQQISTTPLYLLSLLLTKALNTSHTNAATSLFLV